jgi:hypothetical protein
LIQLFDMATRRSGPLAQTGFAHLIFSDGPLKPLSCTTVYQELERDPSQISHLLSAGDLLVKLLSNFDKYAERISQFFKNSEMASGPRHGGRRSHVGPDLPNVLIERFLLRLLDGEF